MNTFICNLQQESSSRSSISMWELLLDVIYTDYDLQSEQKSVLKYLAIAYKESLLFGANGPEAITDSLQSSSEKWRQLHQMLITASTIKTE